VDRYVDRLKRRYLRACGRSHGGRGERIVVQGPVMGVIVIASLVEISLVVVAAAGRSRNWWVRGSNRRLGHLRVNVDSGLVTTGLSAITRAGLRTVGDSSEVGVNEYVSAVAFDTPLDTGKTVALSEAGSSAGGRSLCLAGGECTRKSAVGGVVDEASEAGVSAVATSDCGRCNGVRDGSGSEKR
jgi:hypothetical protein